MEELGKKPPGPPGQANEKDVLDAIAQLQQQLHRWQPVTNGDVLDAVHGVSQRLSSLQLGEIMAALQKLQIGEDKMSDDLQAGLSNIQSGLTTIASDQNRMADDLTAIASKLASAGVDQALVDQVNALAQQAQTAAQSADNLVASADTMANPPAPPTP